MDTYTQLKRFHHDHGLQFYIYAFMYVDTKTILVEDYFPATKLLLVTTRKFQLQYQYQNISLDLVTYIQNNIIFI